MAAQLSVDDTLNTANISTTAGHSAFAAAMSASPPALSPNRVFAGVQQAELVVVVEIPVSEAHMRAMFATVDAVLRTHPEIRAYNQTI
jgi:hypothetical protein